MLPDVRGELRFHDVWFRYDTRPDAAVLRGISLTIAPSQTIALVGTSGHGKSTIIDLIQRMYDPCAAPPDSERGARSAECATQQVRGTRCADVRQVHAIEHRLQGRRQQLRTARAHGHEHCE